MFALLEYWNVTLHSFIVLFSQNIELVLQCIIACLLYPSYFRATRSTEVQKKLLQNRKGVEEIKIM